MLSLLPTAAEVRIASRLRPEQVSSAFANVAALDEDIEGRIAEQAAVVERRLLMASAPLAWPLTGSQVQAALPFFSLAQASAWQQDQEGLISLCVKYLGLGDLYDSAGQLNPRYQAEADNYMGRGNRMLDDLCEEVRRVASNANGGADVGGNEVPGSHSGRINSVWY